MACCYSRSVLMAMYPETEGCKCCHFKRRRDRVLRKKVPVEVVTTNTVPLPTDDVDELVSMIEGTHFRKPATEASKSAKKLKKERQREKKRLEDEALKRQEEERMREIEEARIKAEEAVLEELLRKKREKKKKQRQNKKTKNAVPSLSSEFDLDPSTNSIPVIIQLPTSSSSKSMQEKEPKKLSEMVTIRRHSTAPDTTVTISMKSETGDEDLLYTLVNGQVYTDTTAASPPKSNNTKGSVATPPPILNKSKSKKNKKIDNATTAQKPEVGKENGHVNLDNVRKHEPTWFGPGPDITVTPNPTRATTCLNPIIPNGPSVTPPSQTSTNSKQTLKAFALFSDFESTDEIDLSTLKLPPGITITKVNQTVSGQSSGVSENGDVMPPPGAGHYNIDSNMIVMNPDCDEGDEDSYNSDDYLVYGKRRVSEFETVLSNKEKRKRSKANKCDDPDRNGSSDRITCHEGATKNRKDSKRGSDAGTKSAGTSKSTDRRRNAGSSKTTDSGKKGEKYKIDRKSGKDQAKIIETQQVKASRDHPPARASPLISLSTTSSCSESGTRPLPKITPMNPVKMADVVSGVHQKLIRNPEVTVVKVPDDILSTLRQEYAIPFFLRHPQESKTGGLHMNGDQSELSGGDYNMWRTSTPRQVTPETDFHSGQDPSYNSTECQKTDMWKWSWAFDQETPRVPPPATFDRRTSPSPLSGFQTSGLGFDFGGPNDQPYHTFAKSHQSEVTSPVPSMVSRKLQSPSIYTSPKPMTPATPPRSYFESEPSYLKHHQVQSPALHLNFSNASNAQSTNYCLPTLRSMTLGNLPPHYSNLQRSPTSVFGGQCFGNADQSFSLDGLGSTSRFNSTQSPTSIHPSPKLDPPVVAPMQASQYTLF